MGRGIQRGMNAMKNAVYFFRGIELGVIIRLNDDVQDHLLCMLAIYMIFTSETGLHYCVSEICQHTDVLSK